MAANYDQPPNVEKRVRFFDGQYLQDQDFIDEQKYHVDRQRRHNRTLHIAGIADGLTVGKATDAPARVTVAAGTAIDSDGRQLLLASAQTVDLPASQLANKTVNLYLVYREQPADLQTQAGSKDYSRWLEQPEIRAVVKGEAVQGNYPPVLLAELMLDGNGNITNINPNVRQYSGLRLPGPNADGPTLRADANGLAQLAGNLSVTGNVGIGTAAPKAFQVALPESSKGGVAPGAGVTIAGGDSASIELRGTGTPYIDFAKDASTTDYHARIRLTATDKLAIEGANLGVGTTSPSAKLDAGGAADTDGQISLQLRSGNSGAKYNSNQITLGYNNTAQYRHAIKTRHHSGQKAGNAIDFYVWKQGTDTADTIGSLHTLTLDGGNVGIGTTTPDAKLTVTAAQQSAESSITQNVANNGLNIEADYAADNYLPGIVWTTNNNNSSKPKAGIWISEHGTGSRLYLGTSNDYATGITNKAITVHESGNVGIGTTTAPAGKLDVQGSVYVGTGRNNENYKLVIRGPNNPGSANSYQDLSYEFTSAGSSKIRAYRGSSWDTYLQFLTNASDANADNPQVRLHINHDGNVGIGTTSLGGRLTVGASGTHLQLRRESTETTGGKQLFLELYQNDPSNRVPEVFPSIRFHHNNKFWHRLEARSDGLHIMTGDISSESYSPLKVGDLRVNGQFAVGGGQAVTGIPVIEFRSLQQRFSGQTGSAKMLTYTFTFSRPVISAVPMLSTWFLRYANREYVKEAGVGCYATRITGNTVQVDVYFFLKDASGNYDDPYEGEAIVVVIAQLSQAV